ncbi:Acidic fibroblast growth factor intracellular binding protein [Fasciola gigantica]|uniref:Acidic fibroblast growth factor intracellular binding protein n=1 Tax=Fasciola gigantica TaxID=46835 RepID=A0A504YRD4_FASGI|nr:Acidic fibroblast growth factor intracellular binding protein [Fasciola gigantica]
MIPVVIWLLSYNTYRTHGYDTVFCTDLVPPGLSIELLDNSLFMLGGDENTVEMLVSDKTSKHFAKLLSSSCLTEETKDPSCYSKMRRSFLDEYESYSTEFSNFTNGTLKIIDDYQDRTKSSWNKMSKRFFTISCLIMCWTAHRETDDKHYKMMCPNPCHFQKICPFKDCERLGVFEHQYKCKCPEGSEWDYETHACLSKDLLALRNRQSVDEIAKQTVPCNCDAKGTEYCTSDSSEAKFACHCKPQYTGELCADPVDACKHRIQNPYLVNGGLLAAGDRACNVNQEGNSCFSFISSDGDVQYKCKCDSRKWSPDPRLPYDNCLKRRSSCDSIVCIHGRCVSNEMGTQSLCICRPGYTGRMCSEWVGEWSEWSPWDRCRPACGDFRLAVRSRDCKSMQDEVVMKRECVGAAIEYAQCSEHPCARTEGTFVNTYFAVRQNGIASSLSTAAVVCALITIIWALFFWTTISKPLLSIIIQLTRRSSTAQ